MARAHPKAHSVEKDCCTGNLFAVTANGHASIMLEVNRYGHTDTGMLQAYRAFKEVWPLRIVSENKTEYSNININER